MTFPDVHLACLDTLDPGLGSPAALIHIRRGYLVPRFTMDLYARKWPAMCAFRNPEPPVTCLEYQTKPKSAVLSEVLSRRCDSADAQN